MLLNFWVFLTNKKLNSKVYVNLFNFFFVKVVNSKATFVFDISNKKFNKITIVLIEIRQSSIVKQLKDIKFLTIIKNINFFLVIENIKILIAIENIVFLTTLIDAIFEEKLCLFIMRRILY